MGKKCLKPPTSGGLYKNPLVPLGPNAARIPPCSQHFGFRAWKHDGHAILTTVPAHNSLSLCRLASNSSEIAQYKLCRSGPSHGGLQKEQQKPLADSSCKKIPQLHSSPPAQRPSGLAHLRQVLGSFFRIFQTFRSSKILKGKPQHWPHVS